MTFDALDVVVVPFPFSDRDAAKRRPALVVPSPNFDRDHAQSILAMITSFGGPRWPSDVDLADWQAAGLTVPCKGSSYSRSTTRWSCDGWASCPVAMRERCMKRWKRRL